MYAFFSHHFGLDYRDLFNGPALDESFVKILPEEKLLVFSEDNPRPAGALQGDAAVMTYLGF